MKHAILVAGATGNLGLRICRELIARNAHVRAILRHSADPEKVGKLTDMGVEVIWADMNDLAQITEACRNIDCVVSALAGLRSVIVDLQKILLDGAVQAGVPRFIASDFCTDYNNLIAGENRNFDLRREFRAYLDRAPIQANSIFNGAFSDILQYNTPILNLKDKSIGYLGQKADWDLDFTTMDETAAFAAEVALDADAPRDLQIASFQISANKLRSAAQQVTGQQFRIYQLSSLEDFAKTIKKQRADHPAGENELYAKWQQAQYLYSMFSTQHHQLANARYPNLRWTEAQSYISSITGSASS